MSPPRQHGGLTPDAESASPLAESAIARADSAASSPDAPPTLPSVDQAQQPLVLFSES